MSSVMFCEVEVSPSLYTISPPVSFVHVLHAEKIICYLEPTYGSIISYIPNEFIDPHCPFEFLSASLKREQRNDLRLEIDGHFHLCARIVFASRSISFLSKPCLISKNDCRKLTIDCRTLSAFYSSDDVSAILPLGIAVASDGVCYRTCSLIGDCFYHTSASLE